MRKIERDEEMKNDLIMAVTKFWTDHSKAAPQQWRNQLVEQFTEQWIDADLYSPIMKHPESKRKDSRKYSVLDILADFLLNADQVAERKEEYPVQNPNKRAKVENEIETTQLGIATEGDYDEDTGMLPPFTIDEAKLTSNDPIKEIFFAESCAKSVAEFKELVEHVKEYRNYYVATYVEEMPEKGRDRRQTMEAIRKMDVERVRECPECGGAFYAHDLRRHVCDLQKYPNRQKSACEVNNKRKTQKMRDLEQKIAHK